MLGVFRHWYRRVEKHVQVVDQHSHTSDPKFLLRHLSISPQFSSFFSRLFFFFLSIWQLVFEVLKRETIPTPPPRDEKEQKWKKKLSKSFPHRCTTRYYFFRRGAKKFVLPLFFFGGMHLEHNEFGVKRELLNVSKCVTVRIGKHPISLNWISCLIFMIFDVAFSAIFKQKSDLLSNI